jgi:hypothetical protein
MSKRRKRIPRGQRGLKMWSELSAPNTRAVFPKHYSSMMVKPRGGQPVSRDAFVELYSSHMRPKMNIDQWIAESLLIKAEQERRLKRIVALKDGSTYTEAWHELKLEEDEHRKLSLCFYADRAVFVEVFKTAGTCAVSQVYPSTKKALSVYKMDTRGKYISWGNHKPYKNTVGTHGSPPP